MFHVMSHTQYGTIVRAAGYIWAHRGEMPANFLPLPENRPLPTKCLATLRLLAALSLLLDRQACCQISLRIESALRGCIGSS